MNSIQKPGAGIEESESWIPDSGFLLCASVANRSRRAAGRLLALALVLVAGCTWLWNEPAEPGAQQAVPPPPPPVRRPTPAAALLLEKGQALFDKGEYELAAASFEAAATDPQTAAEAHAYLQRIRVLLGQAPVETWHVDPASATTHEAIARVAVEVRFLLNEARRLLAGGRTDEAVLRLERAQTLIEQMPRPGADRP